MKPLTPKQIEDFTNRCEFEYKFLKDNGWIFSEFDKTWVSPEGEIINNVDAYDYLTGMLLISAGWRHVTEVKKVGKSGWAMPLQRLARYQSPKTKRIYSFQEAQYIMGNNWDENLYLNFCSLYTISVNKLLGNDFKKDVYYTWFYLKDNAVLKEDNRVLELWEPEDSNNLKYDSE